MKISLSTIEKVKEFVALTAKQDCCMDLVSGRHIIDAKSIMGIFSLDLSKPVDFVVNLDGEEKEKVESLFAKYKV